MKRYILTGTPGCGKTSLIHALENLGHAVVREAATDIIGLEQAQGVAEPWTNPDFIDKIITLQKLRQAQAKDTAVQYYDRSPICSYALCQYLGYQPSAILIEELKRIKHSHIYQKKVFFIENLGFCQPTDARKISFAEALKFEKIHEEIYHHFGYDCIKIKAQPVAFRVAEIIKLS